MSTVYERNALRLRELMAYLAQAKGPVRKEEAIAHVGRLLPPEGDDLNVVSDGTARWENDLLWQSTNLVKAGWAIKDGRGNWQATEAGARAVQDWAEPKQFQAESLRRYYQWDSARKSVQRRAWLVRGSSVLGVNLVPSWLEQGFCSLAASQLRKLPDGSTPAEIEAAARSDYDHLKHQELKTKVDEILAFTTKMASGDVVLSTSEERIYVGDVTGEWVWAESEGGRSNLRRSVEWRNVDTPIDFAALPAPLPARLASGHTVVDLTADLEAIEDLTNAPVDEGLGPMEVASEPERKPRLEHLPPVSAGLADELMVEPDWLAEVRELLDERRQVIFFGPPGTGKTWIARKLAADLVGTEQVKLVQFHPAYTYEDFFEGYRPAPGSDAGRIGFELRAGPFRQLVNRAREHPDQAFVLIIDEINRANLAKVFGELYFLLEYRDQAIDLLYSSDETGFTLPPNVYLIGTMNTADRSIALVDSAMRRRFAFVALDPGQEPTRSLLRRWSARHGLGPVAADLLVELNRRIDDPDFQVGPSYFMTRIEPDAFTPVRLARTWRTAIEPLLQEHYYGRWDDVSRRFGLESLLRAVAPRDEDLPIDNVEGPADESVDG
jgi:5-methylcytosine-specific restriction protein B